MAEADLSMKNTIFVVLLLVIAYHDSNCANAPTNGRNVAFMAYSDDTQEPFIADYALDGNALSCYKSTEDKGSSISIDLGNSSYVVGIDVSAGTKDGDALSGFDIYVSSNPSVASYGNVCKMTSPSSNKNDYIKCNSVVNGKYVHIVNLRSGGMKICDLEVLECRDGSFGVDCDSSCHCMDADEVCHKGTGQCTKCATGWLGSDCSIQCPDFKYGDQCSADCHCKDKALCDRVNGTCPNGCANNWFGPDCQTKIPTMKGVFPSKEDATVNSLTLKWWSWQQKIGMGFILIYSVTYEEYGCKEDECEKQGPKVHHTGQGEETVKVVNLKLNTLYLFTIEPQLKSNDGQILKGRKSETVGPFKTRCLAPGAPTILKTEVEVDKNDVASLTVYWKPPPEEMIQCDNIAYFKILYSRASTSIWNQTRAENTATSEKIPGLQYDATYMIMVYTVNNELLDTSTKPLSVKIVVENHANPVYLNQGVVYQSPDKSVKCKHFAGTVASTNPTGGKAAVIVPIIVILAIVVLIGGVVGAVLWRRKKSSYAPVSSKDPQKLNGTASISFSNHNIVSVEKEHTPTNDSGVLVEGPFSHTPSSSAESFAVIKDPPSVKPAARSSPEPPLEPVEHFPIKVTELEDYVMDRRDKNCEILKNEYKEFPEGMQKPCEHGRKRENKHKNRFINIIAYDHSRVILKPMEGDEDSDYINANYIDGYKKPKNYIASQGCNKWTIQDIWRLAWQKDSHRIIMVTNLVEGGKRKCEQYWPEHMNEEKQYNEIFIKWVDCEQTSDFVIRTFEARMGEETRNLKQFHFTAWPDHGVPNRASPIIAFRRKVRSLDESHAGPMIVHCSAGVGRTGTFIAIDYMLEMAKDVGLVDVYGVTKEMRDSRVNMIQTEEQYIFVYDALLEALQTGDTAIPCSEFRMEYDLLCTVEEDGQSKIQKQFENLQSVSPKVKVEDCETASSADNVEKNRDINILPADKHRPYLMTRVQGTNDFINAVFLNGYKSRNSHIITQMPLPITVIDFWRMVYEHNCGSIVMLNVFDPTDETSGQYWPEDAACECGPFIIEPVTIDDKTNSDIVVRELKLIFEQKSPNSNRKVEPKVRTVNLFQYLGWPKECNIPGSRTSVMSLIDLVERSQYKTGNGPVLIHCYDGASQSGLYAAISCIWEKMKLDQEVDIYHTVKQLRYHRPQVIQNLEQYKFCFEMVLAFLAEFETYANFS